MLASGVLWRCSAACWTCRRAHHLPRRRPDAGLERLRPRARAGLLRPLPLWLLTHTIYRIRIVGQAARAVARPGAARLQSPVARRRRARRRVRPALRPVHRLQAVLRAAGRATRCCGACTRFRSRPATGARSSTRSRRRAPELAAGHVVCIFAEGAISRTGNLLPFKRGFERIVEGLDVPDHSGLSRSRLGQRLQLQGRAGSSGSGRSACRIPVTVTFGAPLPSSSDGRRGPAAHHGTRRARRCARGIERGDLLHRVHARPRSAAGDARDGRRDGHRR